MKEPLVKLSKRQEYCKSIADKIHKLNPSLPQVEEAIFSVWDVAVKEGWDNAVSLQKRLRESRESILKRGFQRLRDDIEDTIHQNK